MTRALIKLALFVSLVVAAGCANEDKSGGKPAALTPTAAAGSSKPPVDPAARRADPAYLYLDAARQDLTNGKADLINRVMRLTPEESAKFWPIYQDYEEELFALGDKRMEMARSFVTAQASGAISNDQATTLSKDWFDNEAQRLELLKKYHGIIAAELSAVRAVQFAQIENRVGTVIDLMIASELPLARGPEATGK